MRFGGPVWNWRSPDEWIGALQARSYRTGYAPVDEKSDASDRSSYREAAIAANITIAEVGTWVNVLDPDPDKRRFNLDFCKARLALAEDLGARCCVNIAGSRGPVWDGPDARNYAPETMDMIVDTVREIIDSVKPIRTKYSLETMPWMTPDTAESALEVVRAVDRKAFAIHFDPINMIVSPKLFFHSGAMVEDFIERVGPHICAIHLKDSVIDTKLTVHIQEVRPGAGGFDLPALLRSANRLLDPDVPMLLEHLTEPSEYEMAREYVVATAKAVGVPL